MRPDGATVRVAAAVVRLPGLLAIRLLGQIVPSVDDEAKRRRRNGDDLEDPESRLRDGGEGVVADVGTPRLQGVADEHLLLVRVDVLGRHGHDEQTEDDHDGEPQASDHGGVLVHGVQQPLEQRPFCHVSAHQPPEVQHLK